MPWEQIQNLLKWVFPKLNNVKKFAYARVKSTHNYLDYVESEKVKNVYGDELIHSINQTGFY